MDASEFQLRGNWDPEIHKKKIHFWIVLLEVMENDSVTHAFNSQQTLVVSINSSVPNTRFDSLRFRDWISTGPSRTMMLGQLLNLYS